MPARRGLRPMSCTVRLDPGSSAAATRNGAAEEMSPGTSTSSSRRCSVPSTEIERPFRRTGTPAASSISSVWSRVGAGSSTVVLPRAPSPASSTADFTCALATGSSYSIPVSDRPSMTSGK